MREPSVNRMRMPCWVESEFVDRVAIGEIIGRFDFQRAKALAGQGGEFSAQGVHQRVGAVARHFLVIMARIIVAAIFGPMGAHDLLHALLARRENVEPHQYGPQAVLLSDVVRAARRFPRRKS